MPEPGAVAALRDVHGGASALRRRRARSWSIPDGTWQPSRRRFPTVGGTLVRRTPLRLLPPLEHQRAHYHLDERPDGAGQADWMLGGFLLLRRAMLDELGGFDEGFRMYGEDIDLATARRRRAGSAGTCPRPSSATRWDAATDKRFLTRRTLWHWRGILRFVRKHPERLKAL